MPPITLYDISSPLRPRPYAPNPSKARLALGFKDLAFRTEWIDIPDIPEVRKSLECPATRKLDDGSDFFTLPLLIDGDEAQEGGRKILGDSFDIALHLDSNYPSSGSGRLFPPETRGAWKAYESPAKDTPFFAPITTNAGKQYADFATFNLHVDATFSAGMILFGQFLPLNPESADEVKALMCKRAHLGSWDDISITGPARTALFENFKKSLEGLAGLFPKREREQESGGEGGKEFLWLEGGETPCYADFIVGGWVNMLRCVMPAAEWEEFIGWYGGVFGRLFEELVGRYLVCE